MGKGALWQKKQKWNERKRERLEVDRAVLVVAVKLFV